MDWREQLSRDAVAIKDGRMVYEQPYLLKFEIAGYKLAKLQVRVRSEAPAHGVISRDNFVSLTAQTFVRFCFMTFAETYKVLARAFLEGIDYTELTAPIGTPDIELNLAMTNEGIQIDIANTASGERSRYTETWEQVFKR